jgi:levansucrase
VRVTGRPRGWFRHDALVPTSTWRPEHVRALGPAAGADRSTAVIPARDVRPLVPGLDFWDLWPVREPGGAVAALCGRPVWCGLSAPATGDPGDRHGLARIRLLLGDASSSGTWEDGGPLFGAGESAGSREWAGSTTYDLGLGRLFAYYTAAGVRGEGEPTFVQRIMGTSAPVGCDGGAPRLGPWAPHLELVVADGTRYQPAAEEHGRPGFIKAFRDPFRFDDPATGLSSLLFTGSLAGARAPGFNGLVGIATARGQDEHGGPGDWELGDPLVTADEVNNEMERPHVVRHGGRYYLFVSTQARTFAAGVGGPTGLYGFVADALTGPYEPLNGSGLVLRNPPAEPFQAYSWLVLDDLSVSSFVDSYALGGRHPDEVAADGPAASRAHFGGTLAPPLRLAVDGTTAELAPA